MRLDDNGNNCTYSGTGTTCKLPASSCSNLNVDADVENTKIICYNSIASSNYCTLGY